MPLELPPLPGRFLLIFFCSSHPRPFLLLCRPWEGCLSLRNRHSRQPSRGKPSVAGRRHSLSLNPSVFRSQEVFAERSRTLDDLVHLFSTWSNACGQTGFLRIATAKEKNMRALRTLRKGLCLGFLLNIVLTTSTFAQKALTWQQVRDKFEALNPTLRAGLIGIDESRASEITAHLRPNPSLAMSADGIQAAPYQRVWQPLVGATISPNLSYLHERRHKRELRLESAQKATGIAISSQADLQRTLLSNLRAAFVQVL